MFEIKTAIFEKGTVNAADAFTKNIPQVAFIGRSNVGKSSTINLLTNKKGLAKTSSFPGRTQQLNLFLINDNLYFVDLPGFGYAKTSKIQRNKMGGLITHYFRLAEGYLKKIIFIIDAEIGPTKDDLEIFDFLKQTGFKIIVACNKADKIKNSMLVRRKKEINEKLAGHDFILYSSKTKQGIDKLLELALE